MTAGKRRWRTRADMVLLVAFACFIGSVFLQRIEGINFWTDLLFHVTQAALIGGLADWFAVTALFEKPLGFPWHTALIPRNRVKMIDSIARTVERDLLTPALIGQRLAQLRLGSLIINWVDSPAGQQLITEWLKVYAGEIVARIDKKKLAESMARFFRQAAAESPFDSQLRAAGRWLLVHRRDEQLTTLILDELAAAAAAPQTRKTLAKYFRDLTSRKAQSPLAQLGLWLGEQTGSLSFDDMAQALQQDITALLNHMKSANHPGRRWVRKQLIAFVRNLENNGHQALALNQWRGEVLERMPLEEVILQILEKALEPGQISKFKGIYHSPLMVWGLGQIRQHWQHIKQDKALTDWFDDLLRQGVAAVIEKEHSFIGTVVRDALAKYSDDDLSRFVEEKVGDDLAWIRINGSVVGAAVGFFLFLFLRFFYDPFITPLIRSWFE